MLKVFFFHCPKAGGTSIRASLEEATPQELIAPLIENDICGHEAQSSYQHFYGYHLYTGHYGKDIFDAVANGHIAITNFRHPVSRIVSIYNYFHDEVILTPEQLREERHVAVRFAKQHDFASFIDCDDPRVTVYTRNQHVRQLTRSPWENAGGDLLQAQRLVLDTPCYYVCEYPELLKALDTATVQRICRDNADDLRLYRFAIDSFLLSPEERERRATGRPMEAAV